MKLKIFNRFLIPALIVGAMGTFSSCKDTNEDYWNDIQNQIGQNYTTLTDQINKEVAFLNSALTLLQTQTENLEAELANLKEEAKNHVTYDQMTTEIAKAIAGLETRIQTNKENIDRINALLGEGVEGNYPTLAARLLAMEEEIARLAGIIGNYQTDLGSLQSEIDNLNLSIDETHQLAVQADEQAKANYNYIQNLFTLLEELQSQLDNLQPGDPVDVDALKEEIAQLGLDLAELSGEFEAYKTQTQNELDAIWSAINSISVGGGGGSTPDLSGIINDINTLKSQVSTALNEIDGLKTNVLNLSTDISNLESKLTALTNWTSAISNRITSMFIEAVDSPILGYLKTPLGIQGNILFNWFGQSLNRVDFPALQPYGEASFHGMEPEMIDGEEWYIDPALESKFLDSEVSVEANEYYMDSEDKALGSVYLNVNPIGIDMAGKDFSIVSSKGLYSKLNVSNVKAYYGDLNFGYSRQELTGSASNNGLYEVVASLKDLDKSTIDELHFDLEPGMKGDLVDLLKDRNLSSLAGFANLIYNQFKADGSCSLPALALNVAWSETNNNGVTQNYSVNSNYSLAAATVRPLSFSTLEGADFSKYLRHLPNIDEFLNDVHFDLEGKFQIELGTIDIDVENYKISLTAPTITINSDEIIAEFDIPQNIRIEDGEVKYDTVHEVIKGESISWIADNIQTSLEDFTTGANEDFNKVIDQMVTDITNQINDMLKSITDQVDDSVIALQNEINGKIEKITTKISNYYGKVERVYERVRSLLSNPNHFMQVTMLYNGANGIHRVSSSKAAPSYIEAGKIILMPTTFNAEILTPAYKKYVVVSNVYKSDDYSINATNNATCLNLMDKANASEYMNQVIPGERRTVALNGNNLQAGYTYEILYQALDFRGSISTQKFYINIR